jgi:type IV secretion system protein TrbB
MNAKEKENKSTQRHLDMLATSFGEEIVALMDDAEIIEIMLNPDGKLWAESLSRGKYFTEVVVAATKAENIIKLIAAYKQAIADFEHPEVACELPESGARFQGWLPPVVSAPTFTIRKRATLVFTLDDYVAAGGLQKKEAEFLRRAIKERKNILIAGGTGSGKTTFANAILHELCGSEDRIVVLEDLPELQVVVDDYVKLTTTPTKTMRDLVKGIMRMRPDRIIIGEVRDGAALDLLKAWNTGHPGGICTVHSNSPRATLSRLEDLVNEAVPVVPRRLIQEAVDIIVFMQQNKQVKYRVASISLLNKSVEGEYNLREREL